MARLRKDEKELYTSRIYSLIRGHYADLREQDIAELIGMERRRVNNYLRRLQDEDKIYREGRCWFAG